MNTTTLKRASKKVVAKLVPQERISKHTIVLTHNYNTNTEDEEDDDDAYDLREDCDNGEADFTLTLKDKNNTHTGHSTNLQISIFTELSCGIALMHHISGLESFKSVLGKYTNGKKILKEALVSTIAEIKKKGNFAYIIASNNQNCPWSSSILDEICLTDTPYSPNPNMDGLTSIKLWCF